MIMSTNGWIARSLASNKIMMQLQAPCCCGAKWEPQIIRMSEGKIGNVAVG
jgi:hypothetical protein